MLMGHIAQLSKIGYDSDQCSFIKSNINIQASVFSIVVVSTIKNLGCFKT